MTMLRRNLLFVLIAGVEWVGLGCRGEAARPPHTAQPQISSSAAVPITEARQTSRSATHARRLRRDTPHESFLATYHNPEEGISFRYPRNYSLEEGDVTEHSFFLKRQDDLDIERPGAVLVATVLIPEDGYPNTTFEHGSLQLVVDESVSEKGCRDAVVARSSVNASGSTTVQG